MPVTVFPSKRAESVSCARSPLPRPPSVLVDPSSVTVALEPTVYVVFVPSNPVSVMVLAVASTLLTTPADALWLMALIEVTVVTPALVLVPLQRHLCPGQQAAECGCRAISGDCRIGR